MLAATAPRAVAVSPTKRVSGNLVGSRGRRARTPGTFSGWPTPIHPLKSHVRASPRDCWTRVGEERLPCRVCGDSAPHRDGLRPRSAARPGSDGPDVPRPKSGRRCVHRGARGLGPRSARRLCRQIWPKIASFPPNEVRLAWAPSDGTAPGTNERGGVSLLWIPPRRALGRWGARCRSSRRPRW